MGNQSTLMAWFELNRNTQDAHQYLYMDIPQQYVFKKEEWTKRQRGATKIIGRMYSVSVKDQERYFLRLNLLHVKGATSFDDIKTVNGTLCPTFREAAKLRGLLLDDTIWRQTLQDAKVFAMPRYLVDIFAYICIFGSPSEPINLWHEFKLDMMEGHCNYLHDGKPELCNLCEGYTLRDIQEILSMHGKGCVDFVLPFPPSKLPNIETGINAKTEPEIFEQMKS